MERQRQQHQLALANSLRLTMEQAGIITGLSGTSRAVASLERHGGEGTRLGEAVSISRPRLPFPAVDDSGISQDTTQDTIGAELGLQPPQASSRR